MEYKTAIRIIYNFFNEPTGSVGERTMLVGKEFAERFPELIGKAYK